MIKVKPEMLNNCTSLFKDSFKVNKNFLGRFVLKSLQMYLKSPILTRRLEVRRTNLTPPNSKFSYLRNLRDLNSVRFLPPLPNRLLIRLTDLGILNRRFLRHYSLFRSQWGSELTKYRVVYLVWETRMEEGKRLPLLWFEGF